MPYIKRGQRDRLDPAIRELARHVSEPGELNYAISRLALAYMSLFIRKGYTTRSMIHGVLQDVTDEWYRRAMAPYEDKKMLENGDIGYE